MITLKDGAEISGCRAPILVALINIGNLFEIHGFECVVTSGSEPWPGHNERSAHYRGDAVDLRIKHIPAAARQGMTRELQRALGRDYIVLREGASTENEHFHVQWSPRCPAR